MRWRGQIAIGLLLIVALFAAGCGGDDSDTSSTDDGADISRTAGTLDDADLSVVTTTIAAGFGIAGSAQEIAAQGVAEAGATCDEPAGQRARPRPSQVEIEIVTIVDDCLHFSYDTAEFRSFVADLRDIRDRPQVVAASPLLLDYRLSQSNDQRLAGSSWSVSEIDAEQLVDTDARRGQGITIAVIDSGIDADNAALAEATIERVPDSGYGDYTETGHGTIAAAIIVAPLGDAARALAPDARLLDVPADLCSPADCGCDPCAAMTAAEAIRWSTDHDADIISMSFGYQPATKPAWWQLLVDADELNSTTETLVIALAYAHASGVMMTAAAGNCADGPNRSCESENQFEVPAGHRDVIGVAATEPEENGDSITAWYSTRQDYVELAAPGNVSITTSDGAELDKIGTSYATPFVAAALALLIDQDSPLDGRADRDLLARELLFATARDLAPAGRDAQSGHGVLQIDAALAAAPALAAARDLPEAASSDEELPDE